ncbi:MAG: response regulator [Hyphomicrobiaceae bacterium]
MDNSTVGKRGATRIKMLKGGMIAYSGGQATMPCVVRDMSEGGARLQVAHGSAVPDTFELAVELDGMLVHTEVAWRSAFEVGVKFLEAPRYSKPKRIQIVGQTGPAPRGSLRRTATLSHPGATLRGPAVAPAEPAPVVTSLRGRPANATVLKPKRASQPDSRGNIPILIAEDDPDDRMLMEEAFAESHFTHPISFVENGVELLKYVRGEEPYLERQYPGLILLDLNMPKMDGRTALMHLKTDPHFKRIPVIVLTTSSAEEDIQRTYDLGVTAYVSKPGSHLGLMELVNSLNTFWTRFVSLPAA